MAAKKKVDAEAAIFLPKATTLVGKLRASMTHRHYAQVPNVISNAFAESMSQVTKFIATASANKWEEGDKQAADAYLKELSAQGRNVGAQLQLLEKQLG